MMGAVRVLRHPGLNTLVACSLLFLLGLGCQDLRPAASTAEPKTSSVKSSSPPNVLILLWDTTRADRLGAYGREQAGTRNLDALAREGALFEWAFTRCPSPYRPTRRS